MDPNVNRRFETLEGRLDADIDKLTEEVDELKEFLRGGLNDKDPLEVRVSKTETGLSQANALIAALERTIKGDSLGRNSLVEKINTAAEAARDAQKVAEEAREIAKGRRAADAQLRGQNVSIIVAIISLIGVITVALLSNWRTVEHWWGKPETPEEWVERIKRGLDGLPKERRAEVQRKLREIERDAKR